MSSKKEKKYFSTIQVCCSEKNPLSYFIIIPDAVVDQLNLKENDTVDISVKLEEKKNVLVVKKILTT